MIRRLPIVLTVVAALLAVEPLLHQHPLAGGTSDAVPASSATCVVCAAGVSSLTNSTPSVAVPVLVEYTEFTPVLTTISRGVSLTLPSRAPPAA